MPFNPGNGMTRVVCIHSLTAHGNVGLKPFIAELGRAAVAVPSLLLTGPGNMPGCRRFDYDFTGMLDGALAAVAERGERAVVVVGYLTREEQVAMIEQALVRHASAIDAVVVDPVCGDAGRAYVSADLIAAWPRLLAIADWALPNVTEVTLLTGLEAEAGVAALRNRYPRMQLIVTGVSRESGIATILYANDGSTEEHVQPQVVGQFSGTGDLFAAVWMREVFVHRTSPAQAMAVASSTVLARLRSDAG
jgi:pyridoxine kinase